MPRKIIVGLLSVLVLSTTQQVHAQDSASIITQEQCFTQLQSSIASIPSFSSVHEKIKVLNYADVQGEFSSYYKNISSFGVDLRSPDFDMRVYSFGRDTGYQHPPFSPFPTYTLSDKWEEPAKEYIIAEEYVRNSETNERIFLSCALMSIESMNLKGVTSERYLYDGALTSVRYTSEDKSFKAWYSSNDSYDHEGRNFVTWRRLFIYPQATVNPFFDKYSVADAFPARTTNNLADIKRYRSPEHTPETRDLLFPPELKGYDTVFSLNSYYQAIENSFPQFGSKLALRGVLQYNTVKELLATRGVPGFAVLWQSVLDPRDITKYALLKKNGELTKDNNNGVTEPGEESAFLEDQLAKIQNMTLDQEAQYLLKTISERNPIIEESAASEGQKESFFETYKTALMVAGVIVAALLGVLLVWLRKRRLSNQNIIVQ
jgi:hypothetical protein